MSKIKSVVENYYNNTKRYVGLFRACFPSAVPMGMTDFSAWASSIIFLGKFPDNDSVRFALSSMIMHLTPTGAFKPKMYFILMVRTGAAKQVASQVFQDIKQKQLDEQKKAAEDAAALQAAAASETK